jgi:RNA polymerase sigma-70 factor (ECF subfamily)
MVFRRCQRLLGSEPEAMDAMQDVFVKVVRHSDRLSADAPSSLLYQMATNTCLNIIRSRKRHPETQDGDLLAQIAGHGDTEREGVARQFVNLVLARQMDSTRLMAVLFFVDRLTHQEVADELKVSVSTVRQRLKLFKDEIKDLWERS